MAESHNSSWRDMLRGVCPRCRDGAIYSGNFYLSFPSMNEFCPGCGLRFEREEGYFLGAMCISYALAVPVMGAFLALLWAITHWRWEVLVLLSFVALLPFTPALTLFSRVLWIYFDRAVDPE